MTGRSAGICRERYAPGGESHLAALLKSSITYDSMATHHKREIHSRIPDRKVLSEYFFFAAIGFNIGCQQVITLYNNGSVQFHRQSLLSSTCQCDRVRAAVNFDPVDKVYQFKADCP